MGYATEMSALCELDGVRWLGAVVLSRRRVCSDGLARDACAADDGSVMCRIRTQVRQALL